MRSSTCGPAARSRRATSTCPGCRRCPTARASTSTASPSSSRRCRSTSPATRRRRCSCCMRFGLTTAARAAALCIGCAALTAPLTYALGRSLGTDRDARVAAVLAACSPAMLLFGVTSFDAVFATCGLAAAALLAAAAARRPGGRRRGARRRHPPLVGAARGRRVGHRPRLAPARSAGRGRPRGGVRGRVPGRQRRARRRLRLRPDRHAARHRAASTATAWLRCVHMRSGSSAHRWHGASCSACRSPPPPLRSCVRARTTRRSRSPSSCRRRRGRLHEGRDRAHLAVPRPAGLRGRGAGDHPAANRRR